MNAITETGLRALFTIVKKWIKDGVTTGLWDLTDRVDKLEFPTVYNLNTQVKKHNDRLVSRLIDELDYTEQEALECVRLVSGLCDDDIETAKSLRQEVLELADSETDLELSGYSGRILPSLNFDYFRSVNGCFCGTDVEFTPKITLTDIDSAENMFKNCSNLKGRIVVEGVSLMDISGMFAGCARIESIQLNTSGLYYATDCIDGCVNLREFTGAVFEPTSTDGVGSLTHSDLPKLEYIQVTNFRYSGDENQFLHCYYNLYRTSSGINSFAESFINNCQVSGDCSSILYVTPWQAELIENNGSDELKCLDIRVNSSDDKSIIDRLQEQIGGGQFAWNLAESTHAIVRWNLEKDGLTALVWRQLKVYLEHGKIYTVSCKTDCPGFIKSDEEAVSNESNCANLCELRVTVADKHDNGVAHWPYLISGEDMTTDGSRGNVYMHMGETGYHYIVIRYYAAGIHKTWDIKIEPGANRGLTQWTPTLDEFKSGLYPEGVPTWGNVSDS